MKKRLIGYGTLAALLLVLLSWCVLWPGPGVTLPNYFRIQKGASIAEVEELLLSDADGAPERCGYPIRFANQGCAEYWQGYGGEIIVFYDRDALVIGREWSWKGRWLYDLGNFLRSCRIPLA